MPIWPDFAATASAAATDVASGKMSPANPARGQIRTFAIRAPEGRAELPRIKPGDWPTAIPAERLAVAVASLR